MKHFAARLTTLLFFTSFVLSGCARTAAIPPGAQQTASGVGTNSVEEQGDSYSIYDLSSEWRDDRGKPRLLSSLRGKPQVLAMIYTHCVSTCPTTVADMKRIEHEAGSNVGFVLVSLDPGNDTPARLAAFAREHDLSSDRWTLLTGSEGDVRELAAVLGVRYRRLSPQDLAHSNTLAIVDSAGVVVDQRPTLGATAEVAATLRTLR